MMLPCWNVGLSFCKEQQFRSACTSPISCEDLCCLHFGSTYLMEPIEQAFIWPICSSCKGYQYICRLLMSNCMFLRLWFSSTSLLLLGHWRTLRTRRKQCQMYIKQHGKSLYYIWTCDNLVRFMNFWTNFHLSKGCWKFLCKIQTSLQDMPQPLYNTIVGVHSINHVSWTTLLYPNKNV